jgi:hypothetical protein
MSFMQEPAAATKDNNDPPPFPPPKRGNAREYACMSKQYGTDNPPAVVGNSREPQMSQKIVGMWSRNGELREVTIGR